MIRPNLKVQVDGVGEFEFRQPTVALAAKIERIVEELAGPRSSDGTSLVSDELRGWCTMIATVEVLTAVAPTGWVPPREQDPDSDDTMPTIILVHKRCREAIREFRDAAQARSVPPRPGNVAGGGVPVPPAVQPPAD